MRKCSVKTKITIWITLLMFILSALLIAFTLAIGNAVILRTSREQLIRTLRSSAAQVRLQDGRVNTDEGFQFYRSGVSTLVYSSKESLLAGQLPVSFAGVEGFEKGVIRTAKGEQAEYLVLDLWVASGWEDGVWLRGLLEVPDSRQIAYSFLQVAAVALPVFLLLAALGGYRIVRRAFRPLDAINATASAISEAKDLSRRIGLPPGRDEFSSLAQVFDQLFARLEHSFEAEKQFTADASHELRTPVSIIKGACEYAEKYDETPEERQETIAMIARQADKMSSLIDQLLRMTRLDQGTESARMETVDLSALVEELLREQRRPPERLSAAVQPGVTVCGDAALLARLAGNLVDNAFKYGKPDGHVWVSVAADGEEAQLCVRDDGIGISREQQDKIWQRFYQVDPARSGETQGAGLGLSMVRQIAQLHGGHMTLESVPGIGSSFVLHLPLAEKGGADAAAVGK